MNLALTQQVEMQPDFHPLLQQTLPGPSHVCALSCPLIPGPLRTLLCQVSLCSPLLLGITHGKNRVTTGKSPRQKTGANQNSYEGHGRPESQISQHRDIEGLPNTFPKMTRPGANGPPPPQSFLDRTHRSPVLVHPGPEAASHTSTPGSLSLDQWPGW
jgi:hypothetical protein